MHHVSSLISANTGLAPTYFIALAQETHVVSGNITHPLMLSAINARCSAPVQLEVAEVAFKLYFFLNFTKIFYIFKTFISPTINYGARYFFDL